LLRQLVGQQETLLVVMAVQMLLEVLVLNKDLELQLQGLDVIILVE
jgi:hypothetical protein